MKTARMILSKPINCLKCGGEGTSGGMGGYLKCNLCNGSGKVKYIFFGQLQTLNEKIIDLQYTQKEILENIIDIEK